jgi:uncharacterized protein
VLLGWILALAAFAATVAFPPLTGRVVDQANLLTPAEAQSLSEALAAHEAQTGNQVVVVTVKSLQGLPIEDYGYQLGRAWGVGQKDKNNGVLLIIAPTERKVRIEVGYGLESQLTDAVSKLIIQNIMAPAFRSGQFGPGIAAGTGAILKVLGGENVSSVAGPRDRRDAARLAVNIIWGILGLTVVVIWLLMSADPRWRRYRGNLIIIPGFGSDRGGLGGGFGGGGGGFGGGGATGGW